jgi:RNA polymerase sigma factor (TIGR02999 family)
VIGWGRDGATPSGAPLVCPDVLAVGRCPGRRGGRRAGLVRSSVDGPGDQFNIVGPKPGVTLGCMSDVTQLLDAAANGDHQAAAHLLPLVYQELRALAAAKMAAEPAGHTLNATALVHEAWVRLVGPTGDATFANRRHFFAAAAEAMRRILVEAARRKKGLRHGGGLRRHDLAEVTPADAAADDQLLALDESLARLAEVRPDLAELVRLRYFGGLTVDQTAQLLGVGARTVKRDWAYARAWLRRAMRGSDGADDSTA